MARQMKDSGIEWIGEIPENWNIIKLKNECQFYNGYAFDSNDFKFDGNCYVVRIGDISQGTINLANCAKVQSDNKALEKYALLKDDIVIALSGATIGKVGYIDFAPEKTYINQRVAIIRSSINRLIYKWLNIGYISSNINLLSNSSAQPNISTQTIANLPICLPASISEQQEIADFLDEQCTEIDNVLEKTRASIDEYKRLKQSVITQAVTKGIRPNRPMKDSGIEWIGKIPEGWGIEKLKSYFNFGKGLPITKENLVKEGIPVISYGQIHSKCNTGTEIRKELIRFVIKDWLESNPQSLVSKGDFIFADTSEDIDGCGNCVFIDKNMTLFAGYHTIILSLLHKNVSKYLAYLFKSDNFRSQIRSLVSGIKVFSITQRILKKLLIILPSETEQQEIADYLDIKCAEIDKLIEKKEQLISELETYKKSLIYEYVTGKKEVY